MGRPDNLLQVLDFKHAKYRPVHCFLKLFIDRPLQTKNLQMCRFKKYHVRSRQDPKRQNMPKKRTVIEGSETVKCHLYVL